MPKIICGSPGAGNGSYTTFVEAGREGAPSFNIFGMGPDPEAIERMIELGFDRIIFGLPSADADTVLPMVENYAALANKFNA